MLQLTSALVKRKQKLYRSGMTGVWNREADELSKGIPHSFDERNEVKVEQILQNL